MLWCIPTIMPPAIYDQMPDPDVPVVQLPIDRIRAAGIAARRGAHVLGAGSRAGIVVPIRGSIPDICWRAIYRHEMAHAKGWSHR